MIGGIFDVKGSTQYPYWETWKPVNCFGQDDGSMMPPNTSIVCRIPLFGSEISGVKIDAGFEIVLPGIGTSTAVRSESWAQEVALVGHCSTFSRLSRRESNHAKAILP